MKELTAKQRAKIYREAAEKVDRQISPCCWALTELIFGEIEPENMEQTKVICQEFMLFKNYDSAFWWAGNDKQSRVIALLFSEQIALNP